jgi:hypothetical protein
MQARLLREARGWFIFGALYGRMVGQKFLPERDVQVSHSSRAGAPLTRVATTRKPSTGVESVGPRFSALLHGAFDRLI